MTRPRDRGPCVEAGPFKMRTVSERTGISPALLRAWERRHGLLAPERTRGGHRLYSAEDLQLLARVKGLLDQGMSIGEVARLGRERLLAPAPESEPSSPVGIPSEHEHEVLEALPWAVVVTDAAGRTQWVNRRFSELCGYTLEDLAGRTPGSVLQGPGTDLAEVAHLRGEVRARRPCKVELLNYTRAGDPYRVELEVRPLSKGGYLGLARRAATDEAADGRVLLQAASSSLARCARVSPASSGAFLALAQLVSCVGALTDPPQAEAAELQGESPRSS